MIPENHLKGQGCPKCGRKKGNLARTKSQNQFILEAIELHGKKEYDYSEAVYINAKTKVWITHISCGLKFLQLPINHTRGSGCPKCTRAKVDLEKTKTQEQFIIDAITMHGKREYDYSEVVYINTDTKVWITHISCNSRYEQLPSAHLVGHRCYNCYGYPLRTQEEFERDSYNVHRDEYCLDEAIYTGSHNKIWLTHILCGFRFLQEASEHLRGRGCPRCKASKGEKYVCHFLDTLEIAYEPQKKFDNCKNIRVLPFDFFIPEKMLCIEVNGIQHYEPVDFFGGEEKFLQQKIHDDIKTKFCETNDIALEIIRYDENIKERMEEIVTKYELLQL
jgi:hypothetical protein